MANQTKLYSVSTNGEDFYGTYDRPEDAVTDVLRDCTTDDEPVVWVGEQRAPDMSCPVGADDLINDLSNTDDFAIEAAENFTVLNDARTDLDERLKAMWDGWLKDNRIDPQFFIVDNISQWTLQFQNEEGGIENDLSKRGKIVAIKIK